MRPTLATLASAALLAASASADQILVPSQVADLQTAIDMASAGDVIRVDGGTWFDIVVDKPVVIVGSEADEPLIQCTGANGPPYGAVALAGPGSGTVELVNLRIEGGPIDGQVFGQPFDGVVGGGFDELRLLYCDITAGEWFFPTGVGEAGDAVDVDLPYTQASVCRVTGGQGTDDGTGLESGLYVPDGGRGIVTTGDLTLTEVIAHGGAGLDGTIFVPADCPADASAISGGHGGVAAQAGGTLRDSKTNQFPEALSLGGPGAVITCQQTGQTLQMPRGETLSAAIVCELAGVLWDHESKLVLGRSYNLTNIITPEAEPWLVVVGKPAKPTRVGQAGLLYLDPDSLIVVPQPYGDGAPWGISFLVTDDPQFVGVTMGFQVYQWNRLSNPVFATHVAP